MAFPIVFGKERTVGKVHIIFIPGATPEAFSIGIRTAEAADNALVSIFYHSSFQGQDILLHQESMALIAGDSGYGATNKDFTEPIDKIVQVHVQLFKTVGVPIVFNV